MNKILFLISVLFVGTLFAQPKVSSFSPKTGYAGDTIVISGSGFNSTTTNNVVKLGGLKCNVISASSSSLSIIIPNQISYSRFQITNLGTKLVALSNDFFSPKFRSNVGFGYNTNTFTEKCTSATAGQIDGLPVIQFDVDDINNDGKVDIIRVNTNSVDAYLNSHTNGSISNSSINKASLKSYSQTGYQTALGDFDGDGDNDIINASGWSSTASALHVNSTSSSTPSSTSISSYNNGFGYATAVFDYNGDGKLDAMGETAGTTASSLKVVRNTNNGSTITGADSTINFGNNTYLGYQCGDFDVDGDFDLILLDFYMASNDYFKIAINTTTQGNSRLNFQYTLSSAFTTTSPYCRGLNIADFNNDGLIEVVNYEVNSSSFDIHQNTSSNGTLSFASKNNISISTTNGKIYGTGFADMNNDGFTDLIVSTTNGLYLYMNTTGSVGSTINFDTPVKISGSSGAYLTTIKVADWDGDLDFDILGLKGTNSRITIFENILSAGTKYYPKSASTSSLTTLSSWTDKADGSGINPSSFSSTDTFTLSNSSNSTSFSIGSSDWALTGATLIIPSAATLTIPSGRTLTLSGASISNSGTVEASSGNITITGSGNNTLNGTVNVGTLTTNTSSNLTIGSSAILNVYTSLNLTSIGTFTTNNKVYLKSNSSGTARMGAVSGNISGNINCELYVAGGYRKFRFLAHPFSTTQGLSILTDDIDITGSGGSNNGFTSSGTNNPSAFWYNPTNGDGANYDAGWSAFTSTISGTGNNWAPGQGIIVMMRGSKGEGLDGGTYTPSAVTLDMSGTVNTGNVSVNLEYLGSGNSKGLNLLGNPYPCPIDVSGLVHGSASSSKINKTVYTRNSRQGSYRTDAISSGTAYSVPAYAAFFLKTNASTSSVIFTESMKQSSSAISTFLGGGEENTPNFMRISALINNEQFDKVDFYFGSQYSDTFDTVNDAFKLTNDYFNLYSVTSDQSKVAIDFRNLDTTKLIPLGLGIAKNSSDTIDLFFDANNSGIDLYLYDFLTEQKSPIRTGGSYKLIVDESSPETIGENRLVIGSYSALNSLSSKIQNEWLMNVYPNPVNEYLFMESYNSTGIVKGSIQSISGLNMAQFNLDFANNRVQKVDVSNLSSGIYLIQMKDHNDRIIVKRFTK